MAQTLVTLFNQDCEKVLTLGRGTGSALQVFEYIQRKVYFWSSDAASHLKVSIPTIRKSVEGLEHLSILEEVTGKGRNRLWVYRDYLNTLNEGLEPSSV